MMHFPLEIKQYIQQVDYENKINRVYNTFVDVGTSHNMVY